MNIGRLARPVALVGSLVVTAGCGRSTPPEQNVGARRGGGC